MAQVQQLILDCLHTFWFITKMNQWMRTHGPNRAESSPIQSNSLKTLFQPEQLYRLWRSSAFFGKCSIETIKYRRTQCLHQQNIIDEHDHVSSSWNLRPPVDCIAWLVDFKFYLINILEYDCTKLSSELGKTATFAWLHLHRRTSYKWYLLTDINNSKHT